MTRNLVWLLLLILPLFFLLGIVIGQLVSRIIKALYQLAKFIEVGTLNAFIDLSVLSILMSIFGIEAGWFYSLFKGVSFIIAITNSYFWNKIWTFQKKEFKKPHKEFIQFLAASGIGFSINVGVASLAVNVVGAQFGLSLHLWGIIGAIIAAFCGMIWNFLGYKFLVFKK